MQRITHLLLVGGQQIMYVVQQGKFGIGNVKITSEITLG